MRRVFPSLLVVFGIACAAMHVAAAQSMPPSAESLYADTQAKEKAVRAAFANTIGASAVTRAVRTVVADYEDIAGRFPGCAVCDQAIWNAAILSSDAFKKYGDSHERDASLRLLRQLARDYPASKLAPKIQPAIAAAEAASPPRPASASTSPKIATISAIRRDAAAQSIRVIVEMDREVQFHEDRLDNPDRVFVDLFGTRLSPAVSDGTLRFDGDMLPVRQVRVGRHPNNVTRVVLDTTGISRCSVYWLYAPSRLAIECVPEGVNTVEAKAATPAREVPTAPPPLSSRLVAADATPIVIVPMAPPIFDPLPLEANAFDAGWGRSVPGVPSNPAPDPVEQTAGLIPQIPPPSFPTATSGAAVSTPPAKAAASSQTPAARPAVPLPAPTAPPANLSGGFSVARQLGLGVSRIVIDPGHGGHDPGAKGNGLTEAAIVLDIALRLEKILATIPDVEVILTRRTDEYVSLEERSAIANRENADLFLSIHANGSRNTRAGGVETYFLNFATTQDAAAVAARENATSAQAMAALPEVIKAITLNNKRDESRDFATIVQRALMRQLRPAKRDLKDLGVKQAPFVVLVGAAMPSVLTEISFVTNAQEARLLRGASYRQRVAQALFEATRTYQTSLKGSAAIALQRPGGSGSTQGVAGTQP